MVVIAANLAPNSAWADADAEPLVVAAEPTPIATAPPTEIAKPTPNSATANADSSVVPQPVATERSFYGWQNIVAGHASIGAAVLIAAAGQGSGGTSEAGGVIGLGYVLGGPIIHAVHGDGERAFGALGILAGIPATLGLTGFIIDEACGVDASCTGTTWAYGLLAGLILAPIIDGVALGWEDVPREGEVRPKAAPVMPVVNASLAPGAEQLSVGVGGTF